MCEICEEHNAISRCRICGRYACSYHVGSDGICVVCKETLCRICGTRLSVGICLICARIICRECAVELQPAIRLCRECYNKLLSDHEYVKFRAYLSRFLKKAQ